MKRSMVIKDILDNLLLNKISDKEMENIVLRLDLLIFTEVDNILRKDSRLRYIYENVRAMREALDTTNIELDEIERMLERIDNE